MRKVMRIALALVSGLGLLLGLVVCQFGQHACSDNSVPERDVVRGIEYRPGNFVLDTNIGGAALTQADLGPVYDTINADIHTCPAPPSGNYSTFLAAGTKLYTIKGYQPWFRLAIIDTTSSSNLLILFIEVTFNPHASNGSQLMQLDNRVDSILLYPQSSSSSSSTPSPMKTVRSPQQVARLIALFDQAPLQSKPDTGVTRDFLVFHFYDGTISGLAYDPSTGWTDRGVALPSTFSSLLTDTY